MRCGLSAQSRHDSYTVYHTVCIQGNFQAWRYPLSVYKASLIFDISKLRHDSATTLLRCLERNYKSKMVAVTLTPAWVSCWLSAKEGSRPREGSNSKQAYFSETTCWIPHAASRRVIFTILWEEQVILQIMLTFKISVCGGYSTAVHW